MPDEEQDPYQELALTGLADSELQDHLDKLSNALLCGDLDQAERSRLTSRHAAVSAEIRQRHAARTCESGQVVLTTAHETTSSADSQAAAQELAELKERLDEMDRALSGHLSEAQRSLILTQHAAVSTEIAQRQPGLKSQTANLDTQSICTGSVT